MGRVLLGRSSELEVLRGSLEASMLGSGRAMLVEGEPGIGKSSLLSEATDIGSAIGLTVLRARGGELERDFGYGVVRQLFERHVNAFGPRERERVLTGAALVGSTVIGVEAEGAPDPSGDPAAMQHGLYWLAANLAEQGPLLLCVDDAHWADAASLRWLLYVARRVHDVAIAVVVASRPPGMSGVPPEVHMLAAEPAIDALRLGPLGPEVVTDLVREALEEASPAFVRACMEVTGGNPYLLNELLVAARAGGLSGSDADIATVERLTPEGLGRNVLVRAAHGGRDAVALAQAVAVGGGDVELRHAAAVAGLSLEAARSAADVLTSASLVTADPSLSFVHPLVRTAIYEDAQPALRAAAHRTYAGLLFDEGLHRGLAAMHLMRAERAGDPWVVEQLTEAGQTALMRGAPREAVALLERALAEPAAPSQRSALLLMLGGARAAGGELDRAAEDLHAAVDGAQDAKTELESLMMYAGIVTLTGRPLEASERLTAALEDPPDVDPLLLLRARTQLASLSRGYLPLAEQGTDAVAELLATDIDHGTLEGRFALGAIALDKVFRNEPAAEAIDLALRCLEAEAPAHVDEFLYTPAIASLLFADHLDDLEVALERFATRARDRGSVLAWTVIRPWQAFVRLRRGDLVRAEAYALSALEVAREHDIVLTRLMAPMILSTIAFEHGELGRAEELLDEASEQVLGQVAWVDQLRLLRAGLLLRRGDAATALSELLALGEAQDESMLSCPAVLPWRSTCAVAALLCGEPELASELAGAEVSLARAFGAPRPLGVALRMAGLVEGGPDGIELLREATSVLEGSADRLEYARTLVDLGAALRRAGKRTEAREPLQLGLDLAARSSAPALAERANTELQSVGSRARRRAVVGPDALTPRERHVAELAATGRTNTEVAQELFLSRRTVESHLQSAYRKLNVSSRAELAETLLNPVDASVPVKPLS